MSNYDGREHRRPEMGQMRLDRLRARLTSDGDDGAITLELHPDALDAGKEDARVVELLAHRLAQCRRGVGG